jgi:TPR repeat protein
MNKKITLLLSLTFLFLFSVSSVVFADDLQDGLDAFKRKNYKEAIRLYRLSAEQGFADAQFNFDLMFVTVTGVLQDYVLANKWFNLSGSNGNKKAG